MSILSLTFRQAVYTVRLKLKTTAVAHGEGMIHLVREFVFEAKVHEFDLVNGLTCRE